MKGLRSVKGVMRWNSGVMNAQKTFVENLYSDRNAQRL